MPKISGWINSMSQLELLYNNYLEFTDHMVGKYNPMEVAAIMMAQALSIYRTTMSEEDYNRMVDSISASRDKVQTFGGSMLQ
jgi:hypothetical protein